VKTSAMAVGIVTAGEFTTVVGLPGQVAQVAAPAIQALRNASGEVGSSRRRAFLGKGPEEQIAAHFTRHIFEPAADAVSAPVARTTDYHLGWSHYR